jgi:hypothetical protein
MGRTPLVVASLVVVIAGVMLYLQLRGAANEADAPVTPTRAGKPPLAAPPVAGSAAPMVHVTDQPRLADEPGADDAGVTEYAVGDVVVRDHRAGAHPIDVPPAVHQPGARQLPSALTSAIGQQLRAAVVDCGASVPREARGAEPRVEGSVYVAIVDKQLKVVDSAMALRDVVGAAVGPTEACVKQRVLGLTTAAADQDDLPRYQITLKFVLP